MRWLVSESLGGSFFSSLTQINRSSHCGKLGHLSGLLRLLASLRDQLVSLLLGEEDILLELKAFCSGNFLSLE